MAQLPDSWRLATRADINELRKLIMTTAQDVINGFVSRLDAATNLIGQDLKAAQQRVLDALAGQDPALQAQVQQALNDGFEGPIAALEALGRDNANPVPDPIVSPVPAPSEAQRDGVVRPADSTGDPKVPADAASGAAKAPRGK